MSITSRFVVTHPVLPSLDLARTVRFYEERLGFTRYLLTEGVAVLGRDGLELHFWKCEDENIPANTSCRIQVTGVEELFGYCEREGLAPAPLRGAASRMRVFGMNDPDGNLLWFFELPGGVPDPSVYST